MTETQAKSGTAGSSINPVDEEAASGGAPTTGRAAVGRAAVPADAPSPKFTRAPGMPPPPDQPSGQPDPGTAEPSAGSAGSQSAVTGALPGPAATATPEQTQPTVTPTPQARSEFERPQSGPPARPAGGGGAPPRPSSGSGASARPSSGSGGPARPAGGNLVGSLAGGAAAVGAARVTEAVRAARSTVGSAASRGPRRARLNVKRIDPWSVMKFSFAVSLVLFIVVVVATAVLYLALDAMGVFDSVNNSLTDLLSASGGQATSDLKITAKGVILTSVLIGLVNVVLFTALATLGAFVYNVCADLVGGVELTLAERD
jgi:hypothetical protein